MWNNFVNHPKRGGPNNRQRRPIGGYRARGIRGRGGPHHWNNHNSHPHAQAPPTLHHQQFPPQQLQQPHFGNGNAPQFSAFSDGSFTPPAFMQGAMGYDRPVPPPYRHHSGRGRDREPHFSGQHVSRPKRFLSPPRPPQRPPSPLPGSDEYRQRNIQHTSELIKRQLLGDDSLVEPVLNVSTDVGMVEGGVPSVFQRDTIVQHDHPSPQRTHSTTEKRKDRSKSRTSRFEPESSINRSIDVHEIHQQIVKHISNLSYNKKANIVNQVGNTAGYDVAILQIQKQKRLELSRALRDLCSSNIAIDPDSDVLNDIIPDIGIKLEDLPREIIEELSSLNAVHTWSSDELTYKQDLPEAPVEAPQFLSDFGNVSPPLEDVHMGGENSCYIDSNIVDPELCFKQAEQLISGFDETSEFISRSPFDGTSGLYDNGIIGEFSETTDELPSVGFTEENQLFCDQVPEIHEGDAIDSFVEQIPELHTCGYSALPASEIFSDQISDIKDDLPCSSVNCDFSQPPPDSFDFADLPCADLTTVSNHPVTLFQNDTIPEFEEIVPHIVPLPTDIVDGFKTGNQTDAGALFEIQLPEEPPVPAPIEDRKPEVSSEPPVPAPIEDTKPDVSSEPPVPTPIEDTKPDVPSEPSTETEAAKTILTFNSIKSKPPADIVLSSPKSKISIILEKSPKLPPSIFQEEFVRKPTKNSVLNSDKLFKQICDQNTKSRSTRKDLYGDLPPTSKVIEDTKEINSPSSTSEEISLPVLDGDVEPEKNTDSISESSIAFEDNEESKLRPPNEVTTNTAKLINDTSCSKYDNNLDKLDSKKTNRLVKVAEEVESDENNENVVDDVRIRRKSVSAADKPSSLTIFKGDKLKRQKSDDRLSSLIKEVDDLKGAEPKRRNSGKTSFIELVPLESLKNIEKPKEVVDSNTETSNLVTEVNRLKSDINIESRKQPKFIRENTKPTSEVIRLKRDRKIESIADLFDFPKPDKEESYKQNDISVEVKDLPKKSDIKSDKSSPLIEDFSGKSISKRDSLVDGVDSASKTAAKPASKTAIKPDKKSSLNKNSSVKTTNRKNDSSAEVVELPKAARKAETKLDKRSPDFVKTNQKSLVQFSVLPKVLRKAETKPDRQSQLNEDSSVKANRRNDTSAEVVASSKLLRKADKQSPFSENPFVKPNRKIETSTEGLDLPKAARKSETRPDISSPLSENPFVKTNRKIEASVAVPDLPKPRKSVTISDTVRILDDDSIVRANRKNEKPVEAYDPPRPSVSENKYFKSTPSKEKDRKVVETYDPALIRKPDKPRDFKNTKEVNADFAKAEKSRSSKKRPSKTPRKTQDEKINARQRLYDYINSLPLLNAKLLKSQEGVDTNTTFKPLPTQTRSPASLCIERSRNPENPLYNRGVKKLMLIPEKLPEEPPEDGEIPDSPVRTSLVKRLEQTFGIELPESDLFCPINPDHEFAANSNEGRLSPMSRRMDSAPMNPFADMEPHHISRANTHAAEAHETTIKFGDLKTLTNTLSQTKSQEAQTSHEEALQLLNPNRPYLPKSLDEHIANSNINGNNCANCIHCREKLMKEEKRKARKKELGAQKIKLKRKKLAEAAAPTAISIDIPTQEEVNLAPPAQTSPKKAWRSPAERKIMPEQSRVIASQVKLEKKSVYEVEEEALDYEEGINETEEAEKADSTHESDLNVIPLVEIKEEKDPIEPTFSANILEQIDVFNKSMEMNKSDSATRSLAPEDVLNLTEGILKLNNICKHTEALLVSSNYVDVVTTDTGQVLTSTDNKKQDVTDSDQSDKTNEVETKSPRGNKFLILENISLLAPLANLELDVSKQNLIPSVAGCIESDNKNKIENAASQTENETVSTSSIQESKTKVDNSSDVINSSNVSVDQEAPDSKSKGDSSSKHESRTSKPSSSSTHKQSSHSSSSNKKSTNSTSSSNAKGITSTSRQSSSSSRDRKNEKSSKPTDKDKKDKDSTSRSRSCSSDPHKSSTAETDKKSTHKSTKDSKSDSHKVDKSKSKKDDGKSSQSKSTSRSSTTHSSSSRSKREVKSIMIQTDETKCQTSHTQTDLKRATLNKFVQVGSLNTLNKAIETDPKPEMVSVRVQTDDVEFENRSFSTPHKGRSKKNVLAQMRDIDREIERLLKLKSDLYRRADIYSDESDDDRHAKESRAEVAEDSAPKKSRRRGPKRKSESTKDDVKVKTRRLRSSDHVHTDEDDHVKDDLEISLRDIVDPVSKDDSHKRNLRKSKAKSQADIIQHILEGTEPSDITEKVMNDTLNSAEAGDSATKSNVEMMEPRCGVLLNNRRLLLEGTARTRKLKSLADTFKEIDDTIVPQIVSDHDSASKLGMKTRTRRLKTNEFDDSTTTVQLVESNAPKMVDPRLNRDSVTEEIKSKSLDSSNEVHKSNNSTNSIIEMNETESLINENSQPDEPKSQSDPSVTVDDDNSVKTTMETVEQKTASPAIDTTVELLNESIENQNETIDSEKDDVQVVDESDLGTVRHDEEIEPSLTVEESEEVLETTKQKSMSEDDNDKDSLENTSGTSAKDIWLSTVQEISLALINRNDEMLESAKPNEAEDETEERDTSKDNVADDEPEVPHLIIEDDSDEDVEIVEIAVQDPKESEDTLSQCTRKSTEVPRPIGHSDSEDIITQSRMARRLAHKNAEAVKIVETRKLRAQEKTTAHLELRQSDSETEKEQGAITIDSSEDIYDDETNIESQEVAQKTAEQNLSPEQIVESQDEADDREDLSNQQAEDVDNSKIEIEKPLDAERNSLNITTDNEKQIESTDDLQQTSMVEVQEVSTDAPVTSDIQTTKTDDAPESRSRKRRRRVVSNSSTSTTETLKTVELGRRGRGRGKSRVKGQYIVNSNASFDTQVNAIEESNNALLTSNNERGVNSENPQKRVEQPRTDERQRRSTSITSLGGSDSLENLMEVAYEELVNQNDLKGPKAKRRRGPKPRSNSMARKISISITETIDSVARNGPTIDDRLQSNRIAKEYTLPEFPNVKIQFKNSVVKMKRYNLTELLTMKANLLKPPIEATVAPEAPEVTEAPEEVAETVAETTEAEADLLTSHLDIKFEPPGSVESPPSENEAVLDDEQPPLIDDSRLTDIPSEYEAMQTTIEMPNLQLSTASGHDRKEGKPDIADMDVDLLEEITTGIISDLESQMGIYVAEPSNGIVSLPNDEPGAEPSTIIDTENFGGCIGPIIAVRAIETYVLGSSDRGTLYIYDLATSTLLYVLEIATKPLTALCLVRPPARSADNKTDSTEALLYTGALDRTVAVVDYKKGVVKQRIPCNDPVQCMEYKWGFVFIGTYNGSLRRLNTKLNHIENSVSISNSTVLQLKAAQEGARRVLLVATRNQAVSVRDAMTGLLLRTMDTTLNPTVYTLLCDRSTVYCGTSKHDVLIYGFHDGQLIHKLEESNGSGVVCLTRYKKLLFTGCYNGNIYAYKLPSNQYVGVIPGPGGLLLSMDILDDKIAVSTRLNFKSIDIPDSILAHGS